MILSKLITYSMSPFLSPAPTSWFWIIMDKIRRTFIGTLPFHGTWGTTLETCPWTKIVSSSKRKFQNVFKSYPQAVYVWLISPLNCLLLCDDTGFPDSFMPWLTSAGVAVVDILHGKMMIIIKVLRHPHQTRAQAWLHERTFKAHHDFNQLVQVPSGKGGLICLQGRHVGGMVVLFSFWHCNSCNCKYTDGIILDRATQLLAT